MIMVSKKKNITGFVLIEILVGISLLTLLSSVVITRMEAGRIAERDEQRIIAVKQIAQAVEEYYAENGHYPKNDSPMLTHVLSYDTECTNIIGCGHCDRWCAFETTLSPYIYPLPEDPMPISGRNYFAYTSSSGDNYQTYGMAVWLETEGHGTALRDGGYYDDAYEVGERPKYCMNRYDGVNADWLWRHDPSPDWHEYEWVCNGGN